MSSYYTSTKALDNTSLSATLNNFVKGTILPAVGDVLSVALIDGRDVDFVVTEITKEAVRFDSKDCLTDEMSADNITDWLNRTFLLLPPQLREKIATTERQYANSDGVLETHQEKLFIPSACEIFGSLGDVEATGTAEIENYTQIPYYTDVRNRIRFTKKNGEICRYWTCTKCRPNPISDCASFIVDEFGNRTTSNVFNSWRATPVCFKIEIEQPAKEEPVAEAEETTTEE